MEVQQQPAYVQDRRRVHLSGCAIITLALAFVFWLSFGTSQSQNVGLSISTLVYIYGLGLLLVCIDILFISIALNSLRIEFYDHHLKAYSRGLRARQAVLSYEDLMIGHVRKDAKPWFVLYVKGENGAQEKLPSSLWQSFSAVCLKVFNDKVTDSPLDLHEWLAQKGIMVATPDMARAEGIPLERYRAFGVLTGKVKLTNRARRLALILSCLIFLLGASLIGFGGANRLFLTEYEIGMVMMVMGFFLAFYNYHKSLLEIRE